jgi:hypothetical protein
VPADGLLPVLTLPARLPTRGRWAVAAALLVALVTAALVLPEMAEGKEPPDRVAAAAAATPGQRPAQPATPPRPGPAARPTPAVSRVVLVVEENHDLGQIIGSRRAPFLNRLAAEGTLLTRYRTITHPSLPNYVALLAGDPLGIRSDCLRCHRRGRNLVDQLQAAGISWKAYYQGLPAPCSAVARAGAYVKKVNPFLYLDDVRRSPARCRRVVPLSQLGADLRRGRLPRFAMVTPDLDHDMHSGTVGRADAFLHRLVRQLTASPAWRPGIVLVVTFDEGGGQRVDHRWGGGHVATIVAGPGVPAGVRDPTPYDHYALLRSIELRFGLHPLRHAADAATATIPAVAARRQARNAH